jgi:hypothetical protein
MLLFCFNLDFIFGSHSPWKNFQSSKHNKIILIYDIALEFYSGTTRKCTNNTNSFQCLWEAKTSRWNKIKGESRESKIKKELKRTYREMYTFICWKLAYYNLIFYFSQFALTKILMMIAFLFLFYETNLEWRDNVLVQNKKDLSIQNTYKNIYIYLSEHVSPWFFFLW